jgi:hypothetical protein
MTLKATDLGPPDDSGITFDKWAIGGIVLVLIVVIMLVIATTSTPRIRFVQGVHSIFRRNKGKQPILPTTNTPQQPQPILARRQTERMERLKKWQKPAIPPPPPLFPAVYNSLLKQGLLVPSLLPLVRPTASIPLPRSKCSTFLSLPSPTQHTLPVAQHTRTGSIALVAIVVRSVTAVRARHRSILIRLG